MRWIWLGLLMLSLTTACEAKKESQEAPKKAEENSEKAPEDKEKVEPDEAKEEAQEEDMASKLAQFAETEIGVPDDKIKAEHRPVIKSLVAAAKVMDALFLEQVAADNPQWREAIAGDEALAESLAYFDIMYGPWDRLDEDKPFWGEKVKPLGANFYPEDLSKEALEAWIKDHPEEKEALTGFFTVIQRDGEKLVAVPYAEAYKAHLDEAAKHLRAAAEAATDERLKTFLLARAEAFASNSYRDSDMKWMDLGDGDLEIVIGPYEVYEDQLMGYKAAFEAFITLRDHEASAQLEALKALLPEMEAALPIDEKYKDKSGVKESPLSVVDILYTAGDTKAGIQTLAFVLPNDTVVREQKGSKKVLLRNIAHAKYDKILVPIAQRLMPAEQAEKVSFETFFGHTLLHETAHGLGPKRTPKGETINEALKDLYSTIEETKADVLGTYLNYFLIEKGFYEAERLEHVYASFLGGFFRSVRFGASEAHGMANVIQFNWLIEKGAIVEEDGRYRYIADKMHDAVESLAREVLMIEAEGDYDKAKAFIDKYATMPQSLAERLASLKDIPTDIKPVFPVEEQMKSW